MGLPDPRSRAETRMVPWVTCVRDATFARAVARGWPNEKPSLSDFDGRESGRRRFVPRRRNRFRELARRHARALGAVEPLRLFWPP